MRVQLEEAGIKATRWEAVDGGAVDLAEEVRRGTLTAAGQQAALGAGRRSFGVDMTVGAMGCALSHRSLWLWTARQDRPLLVLEDDAVLAGGFAEHLGRLLASAAEGGWDMIMLGRHVGMDPRLPVRTASGTCRSHRLADVSEARECGLASRQLQLPDSDAEAFSDADIPAGCGVTEGTGRLLFNVPPAGAGGAACGASDGGEACDCVCWNTTVDDGSGKVLLPVHDWALGMFAYVVSPEGARRLSEFVFPATFQLDTEVTKRLGDLRVLRTPSPLATSPPSAAGNSDVQEVPGWSRPTGTHRSPSLFRDEAVAG